MEGWLGKALTPFDLTKFQVLADGGQVSIVKFLQVKENIDFRYEPEFWLSNYIAEEKQLNNIKTITLKECAYFQNGFAFDSNDFSLDGDVYVSKIGDVTQKRDFNLWERISKHCFDEAKAKYLEHSDILMTLTGDPPDVGKVQLIFNPQKEKLSWNQRVAMLRLKKQNYVLSSEFLFVVLCSKYCRNHVERWAKGIRQRNVGNPAILDMVIPIIPKLQDTLTKLVVESFDLLNSSKELYVSAEKILLAELGLDGWKPTQQLWGEKSYLETVQAGRIDAEYYQPKYEEIIKIINAYSGKADTLGNLAIVKGHNFTPKNDVEYRYIELSNIFSNGEVAGCTTGVGQDLPTRARRKVAEGDVIVSSIEGSLSSVALIGQKYNDALCSTGFHVVKSDYFNSETLLVFLKSIAGQMQLKKGCNGSILTAINQDEFADIVLPKIAESVQQKIQGKVMESFKLRTDSKKLLENAKRAVEIAIEQDETTAIQFLNS